jgi:hypothetical protein
VKAASVADQAAVASSAGGSVTMAVVPPNWRVLQLAGKLPSLPALRI